MGREPFLGIVIGRKATGKTVATMKYIRQYVAGHAASGTPARKVLIFDTNNEYSDTIKYPDIRALALEHVTWFAASPKIEIRRIPPFLPNGDEMTPDQKAVAVEYILKRFRNGMVLLEDINSYIGDYMPMDVVGVILSQRHKGIDTILHYHSFGRVQKKIWPHVNFIRMHRSNDSVNSNQNKFPDKYECYKIAENIVNAKYDAGDQYFFLHINNDIEKIHADVPEELRENAINEYIASNHSALLSPMLNMRNESGGKMHTHVTAIAELKKRLMATYFSE